MPRKVYSPLTHTQATEVLLAATVNPQHRAILLNYRRHALLEVAGRWPEILVPELTIPHPVYRIVADGKTMLLDGHDAVAGFYQAMLERRANVFGPIEQKLMVSDWGFAAETIFQAHMTGNQLMANDPSADPDKTYCIEWRAASIWHYASDARLIGEHVYEEPGSRTVIECDPSELITPEQAAQMLAPVLAKTLP
jgi:hypothetical protein